MSCATRVDIKNLLIVKTYSHNNMMWLDIEKVNFDDIYMDTVKVQNILNDKHKKERLLKIIHELGIGEIYGACIYIFYPYLTNGDYELNDSYPF